MAIVASDRLLRERLSLLVSGHSRLGVTSSVPFRAIGDLAPAGELAILCPADRAEADVTHDWVRERRHPFVMIVLTGRVELPFTAEEPTIHGVVRGELEGAADEIMRALEGLAAPGDASAEHDALMAQESGRLEQLSERELEVLRLVAEGYRNEEIAARLDRSTNTISSHRRSLHRKLCLDDRVALARFAIRHGLVTAG